MREILFRGKRKDINKWVCGFLVMNKYSFKDNDKLVYSTRPEIIPIGEIGEADYDGDGNYYEYTVIPETVGQYTGVTDRNGKKIFEGDIVVVYAGGYHTICTVSWAETVAHFQLWQINTIPKTSTNLNLGNYDCEVIGNIHDNPELLKGGAV